MLQISFINFIRMDTRLHNRKGGGTRKSIVSDRLLGYPTYYDTVQKHISIDSKVKDSTKIQDILKYTPDDN